VSWIVPADPEGNEFRVLRPLQVGRDRIGSLVPNLSPELAGMISGPRPRSTATVIIEPKHYRDFPYEFEHQLIPTRMRGRRVSVGAMPSGRPMRSRNADQRQRVRIKSEFEPERFGLGTRL
jgi:hypothetical protein